MSKALLAGCVRELGWVATMLVATALTHGLTFTLWNRQGDVQLILLAGPLLLSVLMLSPYRRWPAYGLGWVLGLMMFVVARHYPVPGMVLVFAICLPAAYLTAYALRCYRGDQPIYDFPRLLFFLLVVAAVLPLVATGVARGVTGLLPTPPWLHKVWWHMTLSMTLGFVLFTPAVLSLAHPDSSLRRDRPPLRNVVTVTVLALALLWLGWRTLGGPGVTLPLALIAPVPLLIYVALRTQIPGVGITNMLLGAIAISLSYSHEGPFIQADPKDTTLSVQLWMLGVSVVSLCFAALVEQRRATQRALLTSSSEVQDLAGRLIVAQEEERARIARDLHDDINQRLAVASMRLSALRQRVHEHHQGDVNQVQNDLIALSGDIRHLSHGLHPSLLAQIGLGTALDDLCHMQRQARGPRIDLSMSPPGQDFPKDVALCLYRTVQEALGNALKHARATRVDIQLTAGTAQVDLRIRDDGQGFDTRGKETYGLGLLSIGERIKLLDGSFQLWSAPGQGTELHVRLPLKA